MPFAYASPGRLDEAGELLATPGARAMIGGTDLLVGLRKGTTEASVVVDLKRIAELVPGIHERDGRIAISATTVLTRVTSDARIIELFPALVAAANVVGSIQIRNRATLAGNLCNASPAADTAPPLIVYGAEVVVRGPTGERRVPVADFLLGPGSTALEPGEIVTAVEIPVPARPTGSAFERLTRRRGVDLATVNLACAIDATGRTRFAFGAVGPRPVAAVDESGAFAGDGVDPAAVDRALQRVTEGTSPISNVRASREYREAMLLVLARRAVETARRRLEETTHGR